MDIGLEKITELNKKINILIEELNKLNIIKNKKMEEKNKIDETICELLNQNINLNNIKTKIENIQKNIKKHKIQIILLAIGSLIVQGSGLVVLNSLLNTYNLLGSIICIGCMVLFQIQLIKGSKYYRDKQYLKYNKIDNIEKQIIENEQNLFLSKQKRNANNNEILKIDNDKKQIENKILVFEQDIERIQNMRMTIINKYLENNEEVDEFLNLAYIAFEQQKNKTKVKKLDGNK